MKKSITPLDPVDLGGITPRADELVTKEVLGYLNSININHNLLSDNDPMKDEYTKFLNDLGNAPVMITNEDLDMGDADGYFDDIDFSNSAVVSLESLGLDFTIDSYIGNPLWANGLFGSTIMPPAYIPPMQLSEGAKVSTIKILGEKCQFVEHDFIYQPQILSKMVDLAFVKK